MSYKLPFTLIPSIVTQVAEIAEHLGRLSVLQGLPLRLRRVNRIRSIQGSLAIEGNTLSESQITAILEGKPVIAPPREVQEARNALLAYEQLPDWRPEREADLLAAHEVLMQGLIDDAGRYRSGGVGGLDGEAMIHMAPPAHRVRVLIGELLNWLEGSEVHPLICRSVFHFEFEFIHPFADGNGRMGRLWQNLILGCWNPLFFDLPVESLVHTHQRDYYRTLRQSAEQTDSAPFIHFMLAMIDRALREATPQEAPEVTPQVMRLLKVLDGSRTRRQIMDLLGLKDAKHVRRAYLLPALEAGLIEMTQPEHPNSPTGSTA